MMTNRRLWNVIWGAIGAFALAMPVYAASSSYRIEELFSNADSTQQFIQLVNVDRDKLAGTTLTVSDGNTTKVFTFPAAPRNPNPPFTEYVLIVSQSLAHETDGPSVIVAQWDYVMPDRFIPANGGTIVLEGVERWNFGRVPTDGFSALYQPGDIGVHRAHSSLAGVVVRFGLEDFRFVSEYANAALDRHFLTSQRAERNALDSGRIVGWHQVPTDFFTVFGDYTGMIGFGRRVDVLAHSVCRFYLPPPDDSHFFTASESECADVQVLFPKLILETDTAFYAGLPDPLSGACAIGTDPVYRLWNPVSNDHWFTADDNARDWALTHGYVPEGYGPKGVSMCAMLGCYTC